MFKSYFLIAWRSMMRNKVASVINIIGLSIAVGVAIVVFVFVDTSYRKDDFHKNSDRIFLVENKIDRSGHVALWGDSPVPLGPMIAADYPQVEDVVRMRYSNSVVEVGEKTFTERIQYVDEGFLDMFTFPLDKGDKAAMYDPNAVIIGANQATRFFGDDNPVGQQITLVFKDTIRRSFVVKGVAEEPPYRASIRVSILVPYDVMEDAGTATDDWKKWTSATFVLMKDPAEVAVLDKGQERYLGVQNTANPDWSIQSLHYVNILDVPFQGNTLRGSVFGGEPVEAAIVFTLIGVFLLLLACFNYINIAIGSASRRLKEIGIRKVVGSGRSQLITQFLGENLLLCFFSLILGMLLAEFVFMPGFNGALNFDGDPIPVGYTDNGYLWMFIIGLLLITAVGAGAYPAIVASSFKIISIFRGDMKLKGRGRFTKVLLTFQFFLSFILLVTGVVFTQNSQFQRDQDWGYNQAQTLVIPCTREKDYRIMYDALEQESGISQIAGSSNHIGRGAGLTVIEYQGTSYEIDRLRVGFNYLEAIGLRLAEGRFFDPSHSTDLTEAAVINKSFAASLGWDEPLGKQFNRDTLTFTVIGVVEDFFHDDFFEAIEPTYIIMAPENNLRYVVMRTEPGQTVQLSDKAKAIWAAEIKDKPYKGFFQNDVFERFYRVSQGITNIFIAVSVMALLLCSMGLFGLISLVVAKRMKEFSIRKVLGATVFQLTQLVNRQFVWLLLIAGILATPVSYFLLDGLLDSIFPSARIDISPLPFIMAGVVILGTALLTISGQLFKVAKANPADALRDE